MRRACALALLLLLAACEGNPVSGAGETGGAAEGEVLGGAISDDMIALEQLRSQAPLAPLEGPSAATVDAQQPQVAGELAPPEAPVPEAPAPSE